MNKIHIDITEDDIKNGIRLVPNACPIALAVKRAINDQYAVLVGADDISFYNGMIMPNTHVTSIKMDENLEAFRQAFDWKFPVQPTSADLEW